MLSRSFVRYYEIRCVCVKDRYYEVLLCSLTSSVFSDYCKCSEPFELEDDTVTGKAVKAAKKLRSVTFSAR